MISAKSPKVIAIGASTGGVDAIEEVFSRLPATIPPVLLVIHMPPGFTKLLAARCNGKYRLSIKEAQTGDRLICGQVLIAPAGQHMTIANDTIRCYVGEKVQFVIPSVDVLFESVASVYGKNAMGVILTGMGADGARGLLAMRQAGAYTIGQDKATSTIYGMPKIAYEMGAVEFQLPLNKISDKIISLL